MKTIQISPDLKLPLDTVVQRKTVVAKNRVGKSNTACAYVEEVHKAGVQTVVLDPKGDWYGIRSSADGKGPGLPFWVMGGDFGDVPLDPGAGTALGEYLGLNHVDVVLDVSDFSKRDLARFGADFFEALYVARKKNRTPLDLVIEEAEDFAPQQIYDKSSSIEQSRCLGALIKIAKKAGFLGIGLLLIAQRTASLNKNVLSQSDGLIIMRTTAPQDLKAIDAWLENQSDEQREYVKKHIQGLPTGRAIVWFPELGLFKETQVRRRETFDAGYTPKIGETKTEPKVKAKVDLERIMADLQSVVEKAKADDPSVLKDRIRRLENELKAERTRPIPAPPKEVERLVEKPVPYIPESLRNAWEKVQLDMQGAFEEAEETVEDTTVTTLLPHQKAFLEATNGKKMTVQVPPGHGRTAAKRMLRDVMSHHDKMHQDVTVRHDSGLNGPMQRILDAILWFESVGIQTPKKEAVAFKAAYRPGGGAFNNPLGALRNENGKYPWPPLIQYGQGTVSLTADGRKRANTVQVLGTEEDLQRAVLDAVDGPMAKILSVLLEAYPESLPKEVLAERAGYAEGGGAFNNPLGRLRTFGLIDYPQKGMVKAEPLLFLEA